MIKRKKDNFLNNKETRVVLIGIILTIIAIIIISFVNLILEDFILKDCKSLCQDKGALSSEIEYKTLRENSSSPFNIETCICTFKNKIERWERIK